MTEKELIKRARKHLAGAGRLNEEQLRAYLVIARETMDAALDQYARSQARRMFCDTYGAEPTDEQVARVRDYIVKKLDAGEIPFDTGENDD